MIISFDTYTNEEIISRSVLRVESEQDVSSPMLGTGEGVYCSICKNPKECIGHSGYIPLNKPIFHPMYINEVIDMLKKVCVHCFIVLEECKCGTNYTRRFKLCSTKNEHYIECKYFDPKDKSIFSPGSSSMKWNKSHLMKEEIKIFPDDVLTKSNAYYRDKFVCKVIPVAPNCIRTSLDSFDIITKTYQKITLNVNSPGVVFDEYNRLLGAYRPSNKSHFDLESIKSLKDKMTGKSGFFRKYSLGKRNENCARAVISPDPCLNMNEVGVPSIFAENMYVPDINDKKRTLQNGDIIILNRQPSLQRHSLLSFKVKLTQEKTIMINPLVCSAFNADFDGDEMNLFCPGNYASIAEASSLLSLETCFISPQSNLPIFYPILDSVSCLYIFSQSTALENLIGPLGRSFDEYKKTTLTSSLLKNIVKKIHDDFGAKRALRFIEDCQKASEDILMDVGFSIGYDTCRNLVRSRNVLNEDDQTENSIASKLLIHPFDPKNALMVSTQSGAKGSMDNVIQITCCVGDQYVDDNGSISSAHKGPYFDLSVYQKETFCKNSFMSGLNPTEYFFHARAGREGVINTSMRTPKSGYIHRRLAKALEDCILHYDGTVRTVDSQGKNRIIRFQY